MAFVGALIGAGSSIIGGLLGSKSKPAQTTQQIKMDPRMDAYIYGDGGLLGNAQNWYQQNKTGLNDQMLAGLNQKMAAYQSPFAQQGYNSMGQLGQSLMNQGVAGNPFTGGGVARPNVQMQTAQQQFMNPQQLPQKAFTMPQPYQAPQAPAAPPVQQQQPKNTNPFDEFDWETFIHGGYGGLGA